jgi:hypothetical protein
MPYRGKFYGNELNVTWSVVIDENGNLAVDDNDTTPALPIKGSLSPAFADSFYGAAGYQAWPLAAHSWRPGAQVTIDGG